LFLIDARHQGRHEALFDQAGLMVRIDAPRWMKTAVEFTDRKLYPGAVPANGRPDWSHTSLDSDLTDIRVRVTIDSESLRVQPQSRAR
jgi:regulation of enolase protein 1 (concanavalin A-like superfamily)